VHDWNYSDYETWGAPLVDDAAIRNHPNFGGVGWHGYGGDPGTATAVRNQYPAMNQYFTEHSGGAWVVDQHAEDMNDMIDYTRNWARSWTKWSLAVDQTRGPHNGGCSTCTGLITVHNGDGRTGQVDYTIEYYTMGHLTKFVRPGAVRIASTANPTVKNVAWKNPDGSKALIAYNTSGSAQTVKVNWGGQSFLYSLPTRTSATFAWGGSQGPAGRTGAISGLAGKCLDVTDGSTANGNQPQLWTCTAGPNQTWTLDSDGTVRALGKCLDVAGNSTANGATVHLWDCYDTVTSQKVDGQQRHPGERQLGNLPGRPGQQPGRRRPAADLVLHGRRQPAMERARLRRPSRVFVVRVGQAVSHARDHDRKPRRSRLARLGRGAGPLAGPG
jgi:glucosylceramidase